MFLKRYDELAYYPSIQPGTGVVSPIVTVRLNHGDSDFIPKARSVRTRTIHVSYIDLEIRETSGRIKREREREIILGIAKFYTQAICNKDTNLTKFHEDREKHVTSRSQQITFRVFTSFTKMHNRQMGIIKAHP
ncbi:hypothetical protein DPMN_047367 [Dreissena polymorpha]|uniref:Uncharacterized protein n=1 Tax=Dreissena polymorpha TaxID=45954 RepID=A0A9D4D8K5_DREPO|nr:hypothetical protein DPMN_047367 [Dreissena polymorpha]